MKLHMVYTTLDAATQQRLSQVFSAAPLDMRPNTLYSPVIITATQPKLTAEDSLRTFEAYAEGFSYPYSAVSNQTLLLIKLRSIQLDEFYAEMKSRFGGVRSYFGEDVNYPYLVVGSGSDLSHIQRGWIANTGTTLQRSEEPLILTDATIGVGEL